MLYSRPVNDLIRTRFSCRSYEDKPVHPDLLAKMEHFIQTSLQPPFASAVRFIIAAASDSARLELKNLGTYGYIIGSPAFIIGVVKEGEKGLEDFGYTLTQIILCATDLGLGTCWLGGTFTRSSFNKKIATAKDEVFPAVVALGYPALHPGAASNLIRRVIGAERRIQWETLFFNGTFGKSLLAEDAEAYSVPLEMLRLAPSASNKQPWRVLLQSNNLHFFLKRNPGYPGFLVKSLLHVEDMQRVDMGIAMCHFELSAREQGLKGKWVYSEPSLELPEHTEYISTWSFE